MLLVMIFANITADVSSIRGWLLVLLLLAVILIIVGCAIAVWTLYNRRKMRPMSLDEILGK